MEKILFVSAHKNETLSFITHYKLEPIHPNLYGKSWPILFFSGEGREQASLGLKKLLANIEKPQIIVNVGVAALQKQLLPLNQVYSVRHVYGKNENAHYRSADESALYDCLTVNQRIENSEDLLKTLSSQELLDRELWEIASLAHEKKIPFLSYKLAIDRATKQISLKEIKENSANWSQLLLNYFLDFGPK